MQFGKFTLIAAKFLIFTIAVSIGTFAAFRIGNYFFPGKQPVQAVASDTVENYIVHVLYNQLNDYKRQRDALIIDTARLRRNNTDLLARINTPGADQHKILKQILDKEDPTPQDVNRELADGILCQELLSNTRQQLDLADEGSALKDSIIIVREIQLDNCNTNVILEQKINLVNTKENLKLKRRLKRWRILGATEAVLIGGSIGIYKLLQ